MSPNGSISCFKAVVCTADDTIEGSNRRSSSGKPIIDGRGVIHYCRDSRTVKTVVENSVEKPLVRSRLEAGDTVSVLWGEQADRNIS